MDTAAYWHVEHANFERLLDFLDGQWNVLHDGGRPNYELILDVASSLRHFAQRYHRSREHSAFAFIVQSDPGMRTKIDRLLLEHLYTLLCNVHAGNVVHREKVEAALAMYACLLQAPHRRRGKGDFAARRGNSDRHGMGIGDQRSTSGS